MSDRISDSDRMGTETTLDRAEANRKFKNSLMADALTPDKTTEKEILKGILGEGKTVKACEVCGGFDTEERNVNFTWALEDFHVWMCGCCFHDYENENVECDTLDVLVSSGQITASDWREGKLQKAIAHFGDWFNELYCTEIDGRMNPVENF